MLVEPRSCKVGLGEHAMEFKVGDFLAVVDANSSRYAQGAKVGFWQGRLPQDKNTWNQILRQAVMKKCTRALVPRQQA